MLNDTEKLIAEYKAENPRSSYFVLYAFPCENAKAMTEDNRRKQFEEDVREEYNAGWEKNGWLWIGKSGWAILADGIE